jgi:hypothetical protein
VTRANKSKKARARAANGGNISRAAIGVVVMVVVAFNGGGGDCHLR